MEKNQEKFNELYDSFNKKFPIEKLPELKLEKYTNLNKEDSFCYWLETRTEKLRNISGATASKFGIYEFNKIPTDFNCLHDDKYAWLKKYGDTAKSAYGNILPKIIDIANYARSGQIEKIDDIDISEMFKWKIAFLYSEQKLINWFSREALIEFVKHFDNFIDKNASTSELQKILIKEKGSKSLVEFDNVLEPIWDNLKKKKNNSIATGNISDQNGEKTMPQTESLSEKLKNLLLHTHNLILNGAPGTGKTYLAKQIAKKMNAEIGFVQFHPSYDYTDFVEGLRPVKNEDNGSIGFERRDGVFKEFCRRALRNLTDSEKSVEDLQKEISTDERIENFLEKAIDDEMEFEIAHGNKFKIEDFSDKSILISIPANKITNELSLPKNDLVQLLNSDAKIENGTDIKLFFNRKWRTQQDSYILTLYKEIKAQKQTKTVQNVQKIEKRNFVFIIDEINRGELSKIFGELFYAIDPGYRGENGRIQTQYQNLVEDDDVFKKGFFVPENVYIVGTMNDIDRSVDTMDFAFRRRFTFCEVKAEENLEMLDGLGGLKDEAEKRMRDLNIEISKTDGLSSSYHIGGAYFLKLNDFGGDSDEKFNQLWQYHLEGLLREYLRGMESAEEKLEKLKKAYFGNQNQANNDEGNATSGLLGQKS